MDLPNINQFLASCLFSIDITWRGDSESPKQSVWLDRIERLGDGRLHLYVCYPHNPTYSLVLGQCELGEDIFVTIREGLGGNNTSSPLDPGWKVTGINLPQWDEIAVA